MNKVIVVVAALTLFAGLAATAACGSLATPEAPSTAPPGAGGATATASVSQQVKDGAQLYVALACVRCHAPDGVGGVPNRYNVGGDSAIPPLNNAYRDKSEQFANAEQITQVLQEGGVVSKKPRVINMPSWNGVINDAQASALAAYVLAGFPHTGAEYDADPAKASDIYVAYACAYCHGQVGTGTGTPPPASNPLSADGAVPWLRNPGDSASLSEFMGFLMDGSVTAPGKKGELIMPAWGQILSTQQIAKVLSYVQDGAKASGLPTPPPVPALPLAGGSAPTAATTPATESPAGSPSP